MHSQSTPRKHGAKNKTPDQTKQKRGDIGNGAKGS